MPSDPRSFSERFGYSTPPPPRVDIERDSDDLRATLWNILTLERGAHLRAYHQLCAVVRRLPDSGIWSDSFAEEAARSLLDDLHWTQVYVALEQEYAAATGAARVRIELEVNKSLERSGIAYEMRRGKFAIFDPEASEMSLQDSESEVLPDLTDEFAPVRVQYQNALTELHSINPKYEAAIADALNALEAVAKIVTGDRKATLSDVALRLFPDGEGYHAPLRQAIEKLYAYANQIPGGRHGRYAEPNIAYIETAMVVRIVGSIMAFLIADYRAAPE